MSDLVTQFTQNMPGISLTDIGAGIGGIITQRREAEALAASQAQGAQRQAQVNGIMNKILSGDRSAQNYADLGLLQGPEQSKALMSSFNTLTEEQQRQELDQQAKVYSALVSGNPEIAKTLMDDMITAYKNSGKDREATMLQTMSNTIASGNIGAQSIETMLGVILSQLPGGTDLIDTAVGLGEEARAVQVHEGTLLKMANDLEFTPEGKRKAMETASKFNQQTAKMILEYASGQEAGTLDPQDIFNMEEKLRKEYIGRVGDFNDTLVTFDNIKASGEDPTGAGDVALVFAFMKMLDPGSVVRESEFAMAQDTSGMFGRLEALLPKLRAGEFLTEGQRENFVGLAGKYMDSYGSMEKRHRADLMIPVKNYKLNPGNVFGTQEHSQPTVDRLSELRTFARSNNPDSTGNIEAMTEEEIKVAYPNTYTSFPGEGSETIIQVDF